VKTFRDNLIPSSDTNPSVDLTIKLYNLHEISLRPSLDKTKAWRLMTKQHRDRLYRFLTEQVSEFNISYPQLGKPLLDELAEYPSWNHRVEWEDSNDLVGFLKDYGILKQTVRNFFDNKIISASGLDWIQGMAKHQLDREVDRELTMELWKRHTGVEDKVVFKEKKWHGLAGLMPLQDALLVGVVEILNHSIPIRECINAECQRLYRVPSKGGKQKVYCGRSCQVKAYQGRKSA